MQALFARSRSVILATAFAITAASCGGGEWFDTEVGSCEELNDAQARSAAEDWAFPQMCEGLGKTYAKEWRCSSGTVEIKCK